MHYNLQLTESVPVGTDFMISINTSLKFTPSWFCKLQQMLLPSTNFAKKRLPAILAINLWFSIEALSHLQSVLVTPISSILVKYTQITSPKCLVPVINQHHAHNMLAVGAAGHVGVSILCHHGVPTGRASPSMLPAWQASPLQDATARSSKSDDLAWRWYYRAKDHLQSFSTVKVTSSFTTFVAVKFIFATTVTEQQQLHAGQR